MNTDERDRAGDAAEEPPDGARVVEGDGPRGFYERFWATPQEIFRTEPDKKVLRQMTYVGTYLERLSELLRRKLGVDIDRSEDIVIKFIRRLFASPAIRKPAFGKYRYYVGKSVVRFAIRELRQEAEREKRKVSFLQRMAMFETEAEDFLSDRIFDIERRQIERAMKEGVIDGCIGRAVEDGEVSGRDAEIWNLATREHRTRREIAALRGDVTADGVKHALERVERHFGRHARELRSILRGL